MKHLEGTYREVAAFPGDRVRFTYDHNGTEVPVGGQVVRSVAGSPWLIVAIKVAPADRLRTRSALVANVDMPIGALAIVMDHVVLRQSLPLLGLRTTHLAQTLAAMAKMVAHLKHVAELEDVEIDTPYAYVFR
jgi:hypothetical protein